MNRRMIHSFKIHSLIHCHCRIIALQHYRIDKRLHEKDIFYSIGIHVGVYNWLRPSA